MCHKKGLVVVGCYPRGPLLNFEMDSKKVTQLDKALQKMAADDDAPLASISDDVQLPPGAYIPAHRSGPDGLCEYASMLAQYSAP